VDDCLAWTVTYVGFLTVNQSIMQRIMACPTLKQAQRSNTWSLIISFVFYCLLVYLGMLVYATFNQCDPLINGQISNINQLVPFYIMKTFHSYPGLPGMYFASILSASLSTLSSAINSWAAITVETFILPRNPDMSEAKQTNIGKFVSFLFGILCMSAVLLTERFPNILQAGVTIAAVVTCPLFALFTVGVCCPQANRKSCIAAFVLSIVVGTWLIAGQLAVPKIESATKFSTQGCTISDKMIQNTTFNPILNQNQSMSYHPFSVIDKMSEISLDQQTTHIHDARQSSTLLNYAFPLANISYLWIGCTMYWLPVVLCILFTYILGKEECDKEVMPHIPPIVTRFQEALPKKFRPYFLCDFQSTIEQSDGKSQEASLISAV